MPERKNNLEDALSLVITRVFDAPRRLVFEAWTQKEHLEKWCAPKGFTIPDCDGEFRPGGAWHTTMIAPDGETYQVHGIYREIVPEELLVFTHIWLNEGEAAHETIVTVRFAEEGGKTRMTFEQTGFKSNESREGHSGGWTQCFERLAELLAKN